MMRPLYALVLVLLSVIWGSAFMFTKVAVDYVPPLTLTGGRFFLAALLGIVIVLGMHKRIEWSWGLVGALAFMGAVNSAAPVLLITWSQKSIDSGLAAVLNATMPLFTVLMAPYVLRDPLTPMKMAGVLLGLVGVAVLIGADLTAVTSTNTLAQFAVILASLCYAAGGVFAKRFLQEGQPLIYATGQMAFAAAIVVPFALVVDSPFGIRLSVNAGLSWLYLGAISSGLAYVILFWLIRRVTATQYSLVAYLIPIVAVLLGWAFLDERVGGNTAVGMALVLLGVVIASYSWQDARRFFSRPRLLLGK